MKFGRSELFKLIQIKFPWKMIRDIVHIVPPPAGLIKLTQPTWAGSPLTREVGEQGSLGCRHDQGSASDCPVALTMPVASSGGEGGE
jgi:hypothetical protein